MNYIANAKLMLTRCKDCLGCNRLELENFKGNDKCKNYLKGVSEVEKRGMEKSRRIELE
jgi:hypothetical protein